MMRDCVILFAVFCSGYRILAFVCFSTVLFGVFQRRLAPSLQGIANCSR